MLCKSRRHTFALSALYLPRNSSYGKKSLCRLSTYSKIKKIDIYIFVRKRRAGCLCRTERINLSKWTFPFSRIFLLFTRKISLDDDMIAFRESRRRGQLGLSYSRCWIFWSIHALLPFRLVLRTPVSLDRLYPLQVSLPFPFAVPNPDPC